MLSSGSHERPVDAQIALSQLLAHAQEEEFKVKLTSVGNTLKTWTCHLAHPSGLDAVGRGKGLGPQGIASALAEALEHYWYNHEETASQIKTREFCFNGEHEFSKFSPDFALIFDDRLVSLDCLQFDSFKEEGAPLLFPAILQDPAYRSLRATEQEIIDRSRIFRYATNSGTAAGLTREDAWLHGLLEVIERDAIGLALLSHVIARRPAPVRKIDLATLPSGTAALLTLIRSEASDSAMDLWDITSDTAVPTLLCGLTVNTTGGVYKYFGSGTSLLAEYAAERALLESLQGFHIHQHLGDFDQPPLSTVPVEMMSLYRRCEMDSGFFAYRGGETAISFNDILSYRPAPISAQISLLVERLTRLGYPPYRRTVHAAGSVVIGQVVVPQFERFYLVTHGISVAPSWRGRQLLALHE